MSIEKIFSYPEPTSSTEKISWMLWIMIESSKVREDYFRYRDSHNQQFIMNEMKFNMKTGIPEKHHQLYGAIHADYIFFVMGVIESFQGALSAAWEMTKKKPDHKKVFDIIVNPSKYRGNIQGMLQSFDISEEDLCRMICFPSLSDFEFNTASSLRALFDITFTKIRTTSHYSQRYWEVLKGVRNVYAHNFRFIFFDGVIPLDNAKFDHSVVGHLEIGENLIQNLVFIGARQRVAMGELAFLLSSMERWIYDNIRHAALNSGTLVLPLAIPDTTKKNTEEYRRIWMSQNYDYSDPKMAVKGIRTTDEQVVLHSEFLTVLEQWGRKIQTIDQKGQQGQLDISKLRRKRDELRERKRPKR